MLSQAQDDKLKKAEEEAALMRSFVQHPGYPVLVREIESKIADKKHEWLGCSDKEKAEEVRLSTKAWSDVLNLVKALIVRGDNAQRTRTTLESQ